MPADILYCPSEYRSWLQQCSAAEYVRWLQEGIDLYESHCGKVRPVKPVGAAPLRTDHVKDLPIQVGILKWPVRNCSPEEILSIARSAAEQGE